MIPRLANSIIVSFTVTALAALFGSLSGYYLSRTHSTLTRVLFVLVGIALYLPYQVVMAEAKGTTLVLYNLQMAAALISVVVPMLFFLVLGRYFIRGILTGALKG